MKYTLKLGLKQMSPVFVFDRKLENVETVTPIITSITSYSANNIMISTYSLSQLLGNGETVAIFFILKTRTTQFVASQLLCKI